LSLRLRERRGDGDYVKHSELRFGQPLTVTKANVNLWATRF